MPETSELIEFRRAFVWLLCGMLLPSVALVAFGVVAVANERAAVEQRLGEDYYARLRVLGQVLLSRLDQAAAAVADGRSDALVAAAAPLKDAQANAALADAEKARGLAAARRLSLHRTSSRRASAGRARSCAPTAPPCSCNSTWPRSPPRCRGWRDDRFPSDHANFRLVPPREPVAALAALRRFVAEAGNNGTVVARVPLPAPLEGFALAAELPGDDPAAPRWPSATARSTSALLVLLYVGIGVGFGLTIREMRRAYKLSRLKTDFVANISHELRTPLTSVRLFAETLREGRAEGPAEVREVVEMLSSEAERLSKLVEKLLDWSRLESGRRVLDVAPVEVQALLEQIASAYKAQQLPATYSTEVDPGLPPLRVDRDAMAQVVLNLLHNAVKFTGPDKRIRLRARKVTKGVAIEVEDNGPGVRPAGPQAHLRALLPRRRPARAQDRGHRAGARHLQAHRRGPRRPHRAGEPPGPGQHLPRGPSGGIERTMACILVIEDLN